MSEEIKNYSCATSDKQHRASGIISGKLVKLTVPIDKAKTQDDVRAALIKAAKADTTAK